MSTSRPHRARRLGPTLVGLGLLAPWLSAAPLARAEPDAAALVHRLASSARQHPLAGDDARIPLLVRLPAGVRAADRGLLEVAPGLGAIRLPAAAVAAFSASHPDLAIHAAPPRRPLLDESGKWTHAPEARAATGADGTGVVVGIIDTGLDVGHPDFLDAQGKSRVAWLLRRAEPRGVHPELEQKYGCTDPAQSPCAIYSGADIDALLASSPASAPGDPSGHGTHVTSIAAGNGGVSVTTKPKYVGVAPGAILVAASPSIGGFSDPDILNAARFIFDRADELGLPAVVNVSLGSDFGPHDGTSELEKGLAAMVGDGEPGKILVVAAGNSGALYTVGDVGPFGIHTEVHASPNALARVPMTVPGASGTLHGAGFVWITFRAGDDVAVGLEGPDGAGWVGMTASGDEAGYEEDAINAAVINNHLGPNAAITPDSNSAVVAWDGEWPADGEITILVRGRGDAQLWVTGTGEAAPGETLGLGFVRALQAGTIAVPASHPDLLAVGCTLNRVSWRPAGSFSRIELGAFGGVANPVPDSVCYFSAAGPTATGAMKPDLLAPGAYVAAAMSEDADPGEVEGSMFDQPGCPTPKPCYVVDARHALASGTSMAAPHVSGAIALLLQRDPTLTQGQVTEILQAGAARPTGLVPFDFQQGPGELDVLGALAVLATSGAASPEPVAAASWFVLASPYARPDPTWPVRGVVELRRADRSVPPSVPAGALRLAVQGGMVLEPLVRVRAGLYRFAVAADRGTGGRTLTVDLRYRGESLGARTLPVAVDAWVATGGVSAVGGCGLGAHRAGPRGGVVGAWLLGAALWRALATRGTGWGSTRARHRRRTCLRPR